MVRDLMINEGKIAPAYTAATAACTTGMGVVIDRAAKTFSLPAAETAENIFVVHKERYPVGAAAAYTDLSDYFEQFNTVAEGEFAPLWQYDYAEEFAVDAYDTTSLTTANAGKVAAVGTDGKWKLAGSGVSSKYLFVGLHDDAGHTLARFAVLDTPTTNS